MAGRLWCESRKAHVSEGCPQAELTLQSSLRHLELPARGAVYTTKEIYVIATVLFPGLRACIKCNPVADATAT